MYEAEETAIICPFSEHPYGNLSIHLEFLKFMEVICSIQVQVHERQTQIKTKYTQHNYAIFNLYIERILKYLEQSTSIFGKGILVSCLIGCQGIRHIGKRHFLTISGSNGSFISQIALDQWIPKGKIKEGPRRLTGIGISTMQNASIKDDGTAFGHARQSTIISDQVSQSVSQLLWERARRVKSRIEQWFCNGRSICCNPLHGCRLLPAAMLACWLAS